MTSIVPNCFSLWWWRFLPERRGRLLGVEAIRFSAHLAGYQIGRFSSITCSAWRVSSRASAAPYDPELSTPIVAR